MAASITSIGTFSSFANVSITTPPTTCGPCTSMQIVDLWRGSWVYNASLPPLRFVQEILDPNDNTTTTSISCNPDSLGYYSELNKFNGCDSPTLDDNCDLVCRISGGGPGKGEPYNLTLAGTTGYHIQFTGSQYRVEGGLATTDNSGQSICLNSTASLKQGTYTYDGPVIETTYVEPTTTNRLIMLPDLTKSYPDEPAFRECTLIQTGPPPVALSAAAQIVLPKSTLPLTSNPGATTTPNSPTTSPTTSARPTGGIVVPTPTTTESGPTTTNVPTPPEDSDDAPAPPPPSNDDDDGQDDSPPPPPPSDDNDDEEDDSTAPPPPPPSDENDDGKDESPAPPPPSDDDTENEQPAPAPTNNPGTSAGGAPGTTARPANPNPSPSNDGEPQNPEPARPTADVPGKSDNNDNAPPSPDSPATTQPAANIPIEPVTVPAPESSTTPILVLPDNNPPDSQDAPEVIVGGSTTIVAGGGVAVGSGTTFSVLPSSSGIVAVADGSTNTLPLPTAISGAGGNSMPPALAVPGTTPQGVVVGGSTTIVAGGEVAVGAGTTFSVLPSMGGVIAIADDRASTLALPTNAPGAAIQPATTAAQGFVLPGQTVSEGGEAVVVGGTSFSALPSGSGVVAISEGGSITLQSSQFSDFGISTAANKPDAFVLPSQTLTVGGSAIIVSGTTYSALPQGSGINVVSDGQTRVISAAEATNIPGIGDISVNDQPTEGYVLDGSVTVLPGGADATISGTVYTALPSGFGVLVSSDSDEFAEYIEQGISGTNSDGESYIIGLGALPPAGQATTVSGVVYSVLPSGSGVLVVANGQSTTLELGPTGGSNDDEGISPAATGEAAPSESVEASTGGSSSLQRADGKSWVSAAYIGIFGLMGMCLIL